MNSGIYQLTFNQEYYYIGKSDDIPNRWKQHWKDFEKGTHSRRMQEAYNQFGYPNAKVFLTCHSDHIDLYESLIIRHNWGPKCLNGNQPREVPQEEHDILLNSAEYIELSTAEHLRLLKVSQEEKQAIENLKKQLDKKLAKLRKQGIKTPDEIAEQLENMQQEVVDLQYDKRNYGYELQRLKNLNWFDRLFNYRVNYTV